MNYEKELLKKMDILVKLTAANIVGQSKNFKEQVRLLSSVGMRPREIADILNKSPNNVSVTLNSIKKESKKQNKQEGDKNGEDTASQGDKQTAE